MTADVSFRIALTAVLIMTTSVTVYYRWKAAVASEGVSRRDEGYVFATVLRLAGLTLWLSTLGYIVWPSALRWAAIPLPGWLRWLGVATGISCSFLMWWTLSSLGGNLTDTVATRKSAQLVTHGPYRWVRHPFYVTAALLMASATVIAANWTIGLSSLLVVGMLIVRTPKEERMLMACFGDEYRRYMARTGRFLPRVVRHSQTGL